MANQSGRIRAWAENAGADPQGYEQTFHLLADSMGIPEGTFNERFINYGRDITGEDITSMPGIEAEIANQLGVSSWNEVGYDLVNLSANRFVFNGVDQYVTFPAWDGLGDLSVYAEITYSATNDQGYVTDFAIPQSEFGRVLPNYHAGEIWNYRQTDTSPIQNTDVKENSSNGTVPDFFAENGHIFLEFIHAINQPMIPDFIDIDAGDNIQPGIYAENMTLDGVPVVGSAPLTIGQHYRVECDTIGGVIGPIQGNGGLQNLRLTTAAN